MKLNNIRDYQGNVNAFIRYDLLLDDFCSSGYTRKQISQELVYLLEQGFIDTDKKLTDIKWKSFDAADVSISITSKGYFYISEVINRFYYIDLVLQDTPIFSQNAFNSIKANFAYRNAEYKRDMSKRVSAVKEFLDYLKQEERKQVPQSLTQYYGSIVDQICSGGLDADIQRIEKSVKG